MLALVALVGCVAAAPLSPRDAAGPNPIAGHKLYVNPSFVKDRERHRQGHALGDARRRQRLLAGREGEGAGETHRPAAVQHRRRHLAALTVGLANGSTTR